MFRKKYTKEEIINGMLNKDINVYRFLDKVYKPKIISNVTKNSGSKEDGKDTYQETVCKVYFNIKEGKYDPDKGSFEGYFFRIGQRVWLDKLRKQGKLDEDEYKRQCQEEEDPDLNEKKIAILEVCIKKLTKDEQLILDLFYRAKLSLQEIARQLNMSYQYIRQKISRIRKKLKGMLGDYPEFQ